MTRSLCIAIVGPTASGKSDLAMKVAKRLNGEILCMDSATVYRGFDVGTSKPSKADQKEIPHHLLDILDPLDAFSAHDFVKEADKIIGEIEGRGRLPIVVGGTYFYLRALQKGMFPVNDAPSEITDAIEKEFFDGDSLQTDKMHEALKEADPEAAKKIHPNDRYRLIRALGIIRSSGKLPSELKPEPVSERAATRLWMKYAVVLSRHLLHENILLRTDKMLQNGLVEEVRRLQHEFPQARALGSIGYQETCEFIAEKINQKQLRDQIIEHTRQLAKRQLTWIRSDSELRFVDGRDLDRIELEVSNLSFALGKTMSGEKR